MVFDSVLNSVCSALSDGGLKVFREFPRRFADKDGEATVVLGIRSSKAFSGGLGDYLGLKEKANGEIVEVYGKRLEMELSFEIVASLDVEDGAAVCVKCADALRMLLRKMPQGLKVLEFSLGEVSAIKELSAFRCECLAKCLAFVVAEDDGQQGEFLDFVLKGAVDGVN